MRPRHKIAQNSGSQSLTVWHFRSVFHSFSRVAVVADTVSNRDRPAIPAPSARSLPVLIAVATVAGLLLPVLCFRHAVVPRLRDVGGSSVIGPRLALTKQSRAMPEH